MAKEAGFPFQIQVDSSVPTLTDISNDVTNHQFATPRGVFNWTGVDKSAMERGLGLADFSVTYNGIFNPDLSHDVLSTVSSTDVTRTNTLTISAEVLTAECKLTDYSLTRPADGNFTWTVPGVLANGAVPTWA